MLQTTIKALLLFAVPIWAGLWNCRDGMHRWSQVDKQKGELRHGYSFGAWKDKDTGLGYIKNEAYKDCPNYDHYSVANQCLIRNLEQAKSYWTHKLTRDQNRLEWSAGGAFTKWFSSNDWPIWTTSTTSTVCWKWCEDAVAIAKFGDFQTGKWLQTGRESRSHPHCPIMARTCATIKDDWKCKVVTDQEVKDMGWICLPSWYHDTQYCDCGCGIWDPDCGDSALNIDYGQIAPRTCLSHAAPYCNPVFLGEKCTRTKTGTSFEETHEDPTLPAYARPVKVIFSARHLARFSAQRYAMRVENVDKEAALIELVDSGSMRAEPGQIRAKGALKTMGTIIIDGMPEETDLSRSERLARAVGLQDREDYAEMVESRHIREPSVVDETSPLHRGVKSTFDTGETKLNKEQVQAKMKEAVDYAQANKKKYDVTKAEQELDILGSVGSALRSLGAASSMSSAMSSEQAAAALRWLAEGADNVDKAISNFCGLSLLKPLGVVLRLAAKGLAKIAELMGKAIIGFSRALGWCTPSMTDDECYEFTVQPISNYITNMRSNWAAFKQKMNWFLQDNVPVITIVVTLGVEAHGILGAGANAGIYFTFYPGRWGFKMGVLAGTSVSIGTSIGAGVGLTLSIAVARGTIEDLEKCPFSLDTNFGAAFLIDAHLGVGVVFNTGHFSKSQMDQLASITAPLKEGSVTAPTPVLPDAPVPTEKTSNAIVEAGKLLLAEALRRSLGIAAWLARCFPEGAMLLFDKNCIIAYSINIGLGVGVAADGGIVDVRFGMGMFGKSKHLLGSGPDVATRQELEDARASVAEDENGFLELAMKRGEDEFTRLQLIVMRTTGIAPEHRPEAQRNAELFTQAQREGKEIDLEALSEASKAKGERLSTSLEAELKSAVTAYQARSEAGRQCCEVTNKKGTNSLCVLSHTLTVMGKTCADILFVHGNTDNYYRNGAQVERERCAELFALKGSEYSSKLCKKPLNYQGDATKILQRAAAVARTAPGETVSALSSLLKKSGKKE